MKYIKYLVVLLMTVSAKVQAMNHVEVWSPDEKVSVEIDADENGCMNYSVKFGGKSVIINAPLGFESSHADFTNSMKIVRSDYEPVSYDFEMTRIKKQRVELKANKVSVSVENKSGKKMAIEFVVSNNDVAFRYVMPKCGETGCARVFCELTGFRFPKNTLTYMCPQSDPMIGWKRSKPSYEEEYKAAAKLTEHSQYGHGYTFPCLFDVEGIWALVSETGVNSRYCASHLSNCIDGGTFVIEFPMEEENNGNGTSEPAFALPGATPWRTITLGETLKPIIESTVTWALVEPQYETKNTYKMGKSTWSWIVWQDDSMNWDDQIKFIDLAAEMKYPYILVDAGWDEAIGYERMPELIKYARKKGVEVFLWYSSSGYWNDIVQSPINKMDRGIVRKKEMQWMKRLGVKGIKVDFFAGDKQETMRLYEDILSDADDNGLMVIFHGCTLPRGWERMYPNYVGSEAVLASENMIFAQSHCDAEGFRTTIYPFTRNAVGCMEFGGCFMNKRLHRSNQKGTIRRTSDVFQLSTCILFQNPIQNFAITPNNLTDAPKAAMDFLRNVPTEWEDTRLIEGMPGKYIVMARKSGGKWYLALTNGEKSSRKVSVDLASVFGKGAKVEVLKDVFDADGKCIDVEKSQQTANGVVEFELRGESAVVVTGK